MSHSWLDDTTLSIQVGLCLCGPDATGLPAIIVGYYWHMRLHIALDDALVSELDRRAGARRRSAYIAELIQRGLDDERRWDDIEAALGQLGESGHDWDADPAAWVQAQRRGDARRAG